MNNHKHARLTVRGRAQLVQRIKSAVRGFDLVGRFGGEEFTVILTNAIWNWPESSQKNPSGDYWHPFHAREHVIEMAISLEVAMPKPGETPEALPERADAARYEAKRKGRNRVVTAEDLEQAAGEPAL